MALWVYNNDNPLSTRHIAWFTREEGFSQPTIGLYEVVEREYAHPEAPEHACIKVLETIPVYSAPRTFLDAAPLILFEANEQVVAGEAYRQLVKQKTGA